MKKVKVFMRQMVGLTLIVFVMMLSAITSVNSQPQYGGVLKIIDVSEGAQPLGAHGMSRESTPNS